jgi:hemin uptake protein HemP
MSVRDERSRNSNVFRNSGSVTDIAADPPTACRCGKGGRLTGPLFASRSVRYSMMTDSQQNTPPPAGPQPVLPREINSAELMQGDREIVIRHGAELYRLNVTRSGKLILRK